ncbi:hypothetical protein GIB67_008068 [Kingdonia uniflora]|uniref:Nodulin-like domain-containing protein n=1 Tax=Kingdonia uniflora TaxID=39325 RepID=A0A7J7MCN1_9MAGN|nr:hypothetical protein GIB67_008068 [Kingdonia uniflora]
MDSPSSPRPLTPWLSLVGIIMLQSISGTNANFPAYSSKLKQLLFLSSLQLNNLIVASEAGKLFGCFPDVAAKHLPLWAMLIIGAILGLIGYGVQFLFLVNKITSISYWQLILLHFIAGNSICWINTVCCLAAASNFRIDHPSIIALTMTYSGLSGKVYTSMVQGVHGHGSTKPSTYLLLNCIVPIGVSLVFSTLVRDPKQEEIVETGRFSAVFIMATATGAYVVFESVAPAFKEVSPRLRVAILVLMIMLPLVMPIVMVVERFPFDKWKFKVSSRGESDFKHKRVIAETRINTGGEIVEDEKGGGEKERAGMVKNKEVNAETVTKEGDAQNVTKEGNDSKVLTVKEENEEKAVKVRVGDEHGMKELLLSVDFWLYFGVYACGATLSTVYLNNLGRISKSRGNCASFLLAISSAFGFFGRLFTVMLDRLTR